ncbi:unnamed protein product [Lepeophtheirus salmonis]|uniref:(salmon louse) hypothetical protein n=1 Tax=Lepeophtheirus salmonis TaxID=72036 RepID=A0A7R8CHL7_LEPSM|nr:unnamed protein product [Lepeophtheirus salmonis]CAF2825049.1 unnamed protein product [Lepeophtheirus salmonis]
MASSKVNTLSETTTDQCMDQIYLQDYSTTTIFGPENESNLILVDTNEQIEEDVEEVNECLLTESYEEEIIYSKNVYVGRDFEIQYDSFIHTQDQIKGSYEILSVINVFEAVISFDVCSSKDELEEYGDIKELNDDEEPSPSNAPN